MMEMAIERLVQSLKRRVDTFTVEVHKILATQEQSKSRIVALDPTKERLAKLEIQQQELFEQALSCVEFDFYRAAHVMAWAGYIDCLQRMLTSDGLIKVHQARPRWKKYKTLEDLRENIPDFQLIQVARDIGLLRKLEARAIDGLLALRNECAHPSEYSPDYNTTLGYVAGLLYRTEQLNERELE